MKQIENFSEDCVELVCEYDDGKDFEAVDEETDELDDLQFQTARLFIKCSSKFDKMGAEEVVSGFQNWHILQYDSPENAKKAYQYYVNQNKVESVEPDIPLDAELDSKADKVYVTREEFDNDYAKKILGTKDVLQYIDNHNIKTSEIKVGVLDSGIDYNHELFEDRLFRTYFNATPTGDKGDEFDNKIANAHGTGTTSCVLSTTPDTVKVGCYKTLDEKGEDFDTEVSWMTSALLQAYADGCTVINMSIAFSDKSELLNDTIKYLKENGTTLFESAGNRSYLMPYGNATGLLCQNENIVAVGATDSCNRKSSFSARGYFLAFFAPGVDTAIATSDNRYVLSSGTSFSSPYAAGIFATLKSLDSDFSDEKIIDLMTYTGADVFRPFYNDEVWHGTDEYGGGVLDAWRAFCEMQNIKLVPDVEFSTSEVECNVGDKITLSCSDDCDIYYTTDLTVANKECGIKYTEPITITEDTVINAIAYDKNGIRGQNKYRYYIAFEKDSEDNFIIDDSGKIIGYTGEIRNLEIPETINGITVIGFHNDLFGDDCECEGMTPAKYSVTALKLPETIEYLEEDPWYGTELESFSAPGLKELPNDAFPMCKKLAYVYLPKVEKMGRDPFQQCTSLQELYLPNCVEAEHWAFYITNIWHLYLPNLKRIHGSFLKDSNTTIVYCPNLEEGLISRSGDARFADNITFLYQLFLPKIKSINKYDLKGSMRRVEFSEIQSLMQFPTAYADTGNCIMILPLSLKEIDLGYQGSNSKTYTIYGTKGSYAQEWAEENDIEFIELNQDTAVYTDVRETCNEYTETLFFDSLGFHKSYQWYGRYDNSIENGIALDGADKELFNIHDYKSYPYYYCVCTSTDIGDGKEHVEKIYSKVCQNVDYIEVEEPTTEESTTEPTTEPSTEPSTEPTTNPSDETSVSSTESSTNTVDTPESTTQTNSDISNTSEKQSTTDKSIKKNKSKISPNTGANAGTLIAFMLPLFAGAAFLSIKKKEDKKL